MIAIPVQDLMIRLLSLLYFLKYEESAVLVWLHAPRRLVAPDRRRTNVAKTPGPTCDIANRTASASSDCTLTPFGVDTTTLRLLLLTPDTHQTHTETADRPAGGGCSA
jgi:hypothetical protein